MSLTRQSSWAVVGFATMVAVFVAVQPKPSSQTEKTDPSKSLRDLLAEFAGKKDAGPGGDPLQAIWESFPFAETADEPGTNRNCWPCAKLWKQKDASIRFLITTVPDPVNSGFGYMFDQVVEAMQRALETQGYVIDRAWLPWPGAGARASPERIHEKKPGLILFRLEPSNGPGGARNERCRPARHRFLALLLVGESATKGIHTLAFKASLALIAQCPLAAQEEEPCGFPIRVIGPYFSGSQVSLAMALKQARPIRWKCCDPIRAAESLVAGRLGLPPWSCAIAAAEQIADPPIQLVCGSASALDHHEFGKVWMRSGDSCQSTLIAESLVRRWVLKFLDNPSNPAGGTQPRSLVVLQEANTTFGQMSAGKHTWMQSEVRGKSGLAQQDSGKNERVFTIPFPLHISQLRASYTKAQLAQLESLGLPRPASNVPVPPGEKSSKAADPVPVQSPLMTTALNSLIVNNLVQTMAQWRSRHVVLVATDPRDTVFLAELIRNRSPDVQLVTTSGDLLYTDPDHRYALWGMVVGSTYPLQPSVQGWANAGSKAQQRRILFTDQSSQGCYNATLVHLGKQAEADMLDYGGVGKDCCKRPGIWISAVGQNSQLIPLYYVSPEKIAADLNGLADDQAPGIASTTAALLASSQGPGPILAATIAGGASAEYEQMAQVKAQWHQYHDFVHPRCALPQTTSENDGSKLQRGTAPPILWSFLFVALTVTVCTLGYNYGCYWIKRSRWGRKLSDRLAASKQRIDFSMAALAVIVLFSWIAELAVLPCRYPDVQTGLGRRLADLMIATASVLMIVAAQVSICWVYWRRAYPGFARRSDAGYRLFFKNHPRLTTAVSRAFAAVSRAFAAVSRVFPPIALLLFLLQRVVLRTRPYFLECYYLIKKSARLKGRVGRFFLFPRTAFWLFALEFLVFVASLVVSCTAVRSVREKTTAEPTPEALIGFERVSYLANGLSPLLPVFFLCAAFFAWGLFLVKKLHFANQNAVPCPFPDKNCPNEFKELSQDHARVLHELMPPSTWQYHPVLCLLAFFLLLGVYLKIWHESIAPIDGIWFWRWALGAFFAGSFLLVFTLCQVYLAWHKLRKLLDHIARIPMVGAFARLPEKVTTEDGHLFSLRPKDDHLTGVTHLYEALRRRFAAFGKRLRRAVLQLWEPWLVPLNQADQDFRAQFPKGDPGPIPGAKGANGFLGDVVGRCLVVLHSIWPAHSMDEAYGGAPEGKEPGSKPALLGLPEGDPVREWVQAAEDFTATWVVRYLSQFFAQLRNLLTSLTVGSLLLILAAVTYPFRPQRLLLVVLTALAGAVVVFIVVFLVQFNRNELISRITRSTPNRFTPDLRFVNATVTYVLPIIGGLMVQFPFFASGIRSLAEPLLHIIR